MIHIAAILPCRGRAKQTVANVRRLLATAEHSFELLCGCDGDNAVYAELLTLPVAAATWPERIGYWHTLERMTARTNATHLIGLANDLVPGQAWLRRAVEGYQHIFGDSPGLLGFNGDSHGVEHSCHFLIARSLLDRYGGWPVWYDHNFGDTELCQRAIADGLYAKAPWAILFHDHPYFGGQDDAVYAEGRAQANRDQRLYEERRRLGWPSVAPTTPATTPFATAR